MGKETWAPQKRRYAVLVGLFSRALGDYVTRMVMDFLISLFAQPEAAPAPEPRVVVAAILVRCARSDDDFDPREAAVIDRVLADRYALDSAAAETLRAEGAALEASAGDTQHLTRAIKDTVAYEDRIGVVEDLWRVVLADSARDQHENAFLRLVASLLGVTDRDSGLARQRVDGA